MLRVVFLVFAAAAVGTDPGQLGAPRTVDPASFGIPNSIAFGRRPYCMDTLSFCAKEYLFDMDDHVVDLKEFIRSAQRNQRLLAWIMRQLAAYIRRKQKNNNKLL